MTDSTDNARGPERTMPDQADLHKLLRYDAETGALFWRERPKEYFAQSSMLKQIQQANAWNARYAGKEALVNINSDGYRAGNLLKVKVLAHRVIFKLHHGYCPPVLDHINRVKTDNRIENLREATFAENSRNYAKPAGKHSQYRGVSKTSKAATWQAYISCNESKRKLHLGCFDDEVSAALAYDEAAQKMHGEFAMLNFPRAALAALSPTGGNADG